MTAEEFSMKWAPYTPPEWYGLALNHEGVIDYLDKEFDEYVKFDETFEIHQIKIKWNYICVYTNAAKEYSDRWTEECNKIYNTKNN